MRKAPPDSDRRAGRRDVAVADVGELVQEHSAELGAERRIVRPPGRVFQPPGDETKVQAQDGASGAP